MNTQAVECFSSFPDIPSKTDFLQGSEADSLHSDPPKAFRQFQVFYVSGVRGIQIHRPQLDFPRLYIHNIPVSFISVLIGNSVAGIIIHLTDCGYTLSHSAGVPLDIQQGT